MSASSRPHRPDRADRPQAVLFDVEGVIVHPDVDALDRGYASLWPGLQLAEVEAARDTPALYPLWERYSIGALDSRSYWRAVIESLGRTADDVRLDALAELLARAWWADVDPAILALVDALKASPAAGGPLRVGLLSNSCADHDTALAAFAPRFDAACFSHRVGRRKPDAAAYLGAAEALGVEAEFILFIDDRVRNTAAAERVGMATIVFTDAEALRETLLARGLIASLDAARVP